MLLIHDSGNIIRALHQRTGGGASGQNHLELLRFLIQKLRQYLLAQQPAGNRVQCLVQQQNIRSFTPDVLRYPFKIRQIARLLPAFLRFTHPEAEANASHFI